MKQKQTKKISILVGSLLLVFVTFVFVFGRKILLVNISPSVPVGLYVVNPFKKNLSYGDLVRFCGPRWIVKRQYVPASQNCSYGRPALMKRVEGLPGDTIENRAGRIFVNGKITKAVALRADSHGNPVPQIGKLVVRDNEFFPLSTFNVRSLDGRYFGAVDRKRILYHYLCVVCFGKYGANEND